ncbi:SRPBCC family protein [Terricaulis silvestris]|uniref:Polyketide cyclase / dehydrase and lipid transport n=1 Tax=Terricaulis silvestris TaxID=2686094 RepID=A0A6I6MM35_9CAUL|nr:SRPBCC family protein [Terricaulis silvestris]QGZ93777.1 Polyketide cyclase / dehydrase and lipid transport [Terricaulis silvestris]
MPAEEARIEYARVVAELDYPLEAVWRVVSAFGGVERWIAGVDSCAVEGSGVGAVRVVGLAGRTVGERLDRLDQAEHTIVYSVLPPHAMPAENVRGTIQLRAVSPGTTAVTWRSDATRIDGNPAALSARIEAFYRASIEGLRRLLAEG